MNGLPVLLYTHTHTAIMNYANQFLLVCVLNHPKFIASKCAQFIMSATEESVAAAREKRPTDEKLRPYRMMCFASAPGSGIIRVTVSFFSRSHPCQFLAHYR